MKNLQYLAFGALHTLLAASALAQSGGQFSLSVSSVLEGPAAGTDSVVVYASGLSGNPEGVPANTNWLTFITNPSAGPNGGNFQNGANLLRFRFTANTGPTRTASVNIGGATLTVTQAGASYVPAKPLTLISSGLEGSMGIAADKQGNLYIADTAGKSILQWSASSQQLVKVLDNGIWAPLHVAVSPSGALYALQTYPPTAQRSIIRFSAGGGPTATIWESSTITATGFCFDSAGETIFLAVAPSTQTCAVDPFGSTWVADIADRNLGRNPLNPHGGSLVFPLGSLQGVPNGVAIDNGGYVYFLDVGQPTSLKKLDPLTNETITLNAEMNPAYFSTVDTAGNVYTTSSMQQTVDEWPRAYIPSTPLVEGPQAGSDSIQVLTSHTLTGPYAPVVSDPTWLKVISVDGGVVKFTFTTSPGYPREGTITILGVPVKVQQLETAAQAALQVKPDSMMIVAGDGQSTTSGQPFGTKLQVQVLNVYGNPLPSQTVAFMTSGATLGLPTNLVITDLNGIAAMPVSAAVPGPIRVTATLQGTAISKIFNLTAVTNGLNATGGDNQATLMGQPFRTNLKAIVYSPTAQPISGVSVTFTTPSSGPSATFPNGQSSVTVQTGSDGTASAPTLTANGIPGPFIVRANAPSLPLIAAWANFNLTNYSRLYSMAGNNQSTLINTAFGNRLKVLVVDQNANPVPATQVTFVVNPGTGGAAATFPTAQTAIVTTDVSGTATAPDLTANGTAGAFTVVASVQGLPSLTFTLKNDVAGFDFGGSQTGVTTRTLASPFVVHASAQATSGTMVFTVVPDPVTGASGSFQGAGSVTVRLDAQGYGTSPQLTANDISGTFTVRASDGVSTAVTTVSTLGCTNPGGTTVIVQQATENSLRSAVDQACAGSVIQLSGLTGVITLTKRLRIDDDLSIVGPGASQLAIDGGRATRLFFIGGGNVSISAVTLQNGLANPGNSGFGGAAAGMGGAIFMNGGNVNLTGVTFMSNSAVGGNAQGDVNGGLGGGGMGGGPTGVNGFIGGDGGDLFGLGNRNRGGSATGLGAGGSALATIAGSGSFGGGGAHGLASPGGNPPGQSGAGGFGGGGGAGFAPGGIASQKSVNVGNGGFGGGMGVYGSNYTNVPGGGGAGFGGAIFQRAGTLTLNNNQFLSNSALGGQAVLTGDTAQSGVTVTAANNGQGKGGALFIYSGATAVNNGSVFGTGTSGSVAADAGRPSIGSSGAPYTTGSTCPGQDTADVCGLLLPAATVTLTGPASAPYGSTFRLTAQSNSGATPAIVVADGPCRATGNSFAMTAGAGVCRFQATWPATGAYGGAVASVSVAAAPMPLMPTIAVFDKTFDGTVNAVVRSCSLSEVLPADAGKVMCTAASVKFASAGVSAAVPVLASGITLSGPAAANYVLSTDQTGTKANISLPSAATACVAAPAGLTAFWAGEDNGTDAKSAYNASVSGGATFAPGKVGHAFSLDGSPNQFVALPAAAFTGGTAFTFETWFKTSGALGGVILGAQTGAPYGASPATFIPMLYVSANGRLVSQAAISADNAPLASAIQVNDAAWHHVAVAYDGTTQVVYLDGASIGSRALSLAPGVAALSYQLGTGYTNGWAGGNAGWYTFSGQIDEASVYSRTLSAAEVMSIVQAGAFGKCGPTRGTAVTAILDGFNNPYSSNFYFSPGLLYTNVNFNVDVANATDPGNYLMLGRTDGQDPQTTSCAGPLAAGDVNIGVSRVTYQNSPPYFAQVFFASGPANMRFRMVACKVNLTNAAKSIVAVANPNATLAGDSLSTSFGTQPVIAVSSVTANAATGPSISAGGSLTSAPASIWLNLSSAPGAATVNSSNVKLLTGFIGGSGCASTGVPVPGSVTTRGSSVVFTPQSALGDGSYRVVVCSTLRGQNGAPLGATLTGWVADGGADFTRDFTGPSTSSQ